MNQINEFDFESESYLAEINISLSEKLDKLKKSLNLTSENNLEIRANEARSLYFSMTVFANSILEITDFTLKKQGEHYGSYRTDFYNSWSKSQFALGESYFVRDDLIQASDYVRKFNHKVIPVIETVMQRLPNSDEHFVKKLEIASTLFLLENFTEYVSLAYHATFTNGYINALPEDIVSYSFDLKTTIPVHIRRLALFAAPLRFTNFKVRNFDNLTGLGDSVISPWLETITKLSEEMLPIFEKIYESQNSHSCCVLM